MEKRLLVQMMVVCRHGQVLVENRYLICFSLHPPTAQSLDFQSDPFIDAICGGVGKMIEQAVHDELAKLMVPFVGRNKD